MHVYCTPSLSFYTGLELRVCEDGRRLVASNRRRIPEQNRAAVTPAVVQELVEVALARRVGAGPGAAGSEVQREGAAHSTAVVRPRPVQRPPVVHGHATRREHRWHGVPVRKREPDGLQRRVPLADEVLVVEECRDAHEPVAPDVCWQQRSASEGRVTSAGRGRPLLDSREPRTSIIGPESGPTSERATHAVKISLSRGSSPSSTVSNELNQ
jgi:hypothetical protein